MSETQPNESNTRRRRDPAAGLGRTQVLVLRLLADRNKSVRTLAYDWPGLTEPSVRSAIDRLGRRALVDATDWDANDGRVFGLTDRGRAVERALNVVDGEDLDG